MTEQYPKMATMKIGGKIVPIMRDGQPIIFANRDEELAYDKGGEPHDGKPEMHSQQSPSYIYQAPDWTAQLHQRAKGKTP